MDEEKADLSKEDFSQLTLNHFRTALKQFPNAERFVLKKIFDSTIEVIPEDGDFTDSAKAALENKIVLRAFQLLLQMEFPEADLSSFFENGVFAEPAADNEEQGVEGAQQRSVYGNT